MTDMLIRGGKFGHRHTQRENDEGTELPIMGATSQSSTSLCPGLLLSLPFPTVWSQGCPFLLFIAKSCSTLGDLVTCSPPGFSVHHYLPEFVQIHVHWISDVIQPSHPLSPLLLLPSIFPSIRVFSHESPLHIRWPKYWCLSFSISPSNEYSGMISFWMEWFDSLLSKGLSRVFSSASLKVLILWLSAFFMVQFSHLYMTPGKNHSFDYKDLCQQSDVSAFLKHCVGLS